MVGMLRTRRAGFSLIELVIVIAILGILAAVAVPRMSRGAAGATSSRLRADLATMRSALELYYVEHNNTYPAVADFENALVNQFSDVDGNLNATKTGVFIYGPYLKEIPTIQVGARKGSNGVAAADAAGIGWLYNATTGVITANSDTATDDAGTLFSTY
ncbi:MAG: type II secretion system protein [Planctomycetota bacterium]